MLWFRLTVVLPGHTIQPTRSRDDVVEPNPARTGPPGAPIIWVSVSVALFNHGRWWPLMERSLDCSYCAKNCSVMHSECYVKEKSTALRISIAFLGASLGCRSFMEIVSVTQKYTEKNQSTTKWSSNSRGDTNDQWRCSRQDNWG